MQQVKLFVGVESSRQELEDEINEWLKASGARVVHMTANIAPQTPRGGTAAGGLGHKNFGASDLLVAMTYETA